MASKLFLIALLGALVSTATARSLSANGESTREEPARMLLNAGVSIGAGAAAPGLASVGAGVTAGIGHAPPPGTASVSIGATIGATVGNAPPPAVTANVGATIGLGAGAPLGGH